MGRAGTRLRRGHRGGSRRQRTPYAGRRTRRRLRRHGDRLGLRRLCGGRGVRVVPTGVGGRGVGPRTLRVQRRGRLRGGPDVWRRHRHPGDAGTRLGSWPGGVRVSAGHRRPRRGGGVRPHRRRAAGVAGPRPARTSRRLVRGRIRRPSRTGPHGGGRGGRPAGRGMHRHPGDRRARLSPRSTAHGSGRVVGGGAPA